MIAGTAHPSARAATATVDHRFRAMGCDVRIAATSADRPQVELDDAARRAEQFVHAAAARLTRFDPASELRQLGARPHRTISVSPMLGHALHVALEAARASGGLLDPTLAAPLVSAGYADDWDHERRVDLSTLLALAPPRQPASPSPRAAWADVTVDRAAGTVERAAGLQLDLGATAKGLIADLALRMLGAVDTGFVDAGGDLAMATPGGQELHAADPFGRPDLTLRTTGPCGVATSSIAGRCWLGPAGPAHHLLDPSTGQPAFTGVVQATAAGPTTAEAERLAGQALLSGPEVGATLLTRFGGLLVLDDSTTIRLPGALLQ
ncbi:MAG: FAD:protein FMN transferase [Solirubrobacteraceae bacterium]|nr:FAD:protein FMN transferase [Solirubrobacteraceae bacterium]